MRYTKPFTLILLLTVIAACSPAAPAGTAVTVPTNTQGCELMKVEADALLAKANAAKTEDAQALKDAAAAYSDPCKPIPDTAMVSIWNYDPSKSDELQRWGQFGGLSADIKVVGTGADAYFQGTAPQNQSLRIRPFELPNQVSYAYQGQDLPMYIVPVDGAKTRALPLLQKQRSSSIFLDPLTGGQVTWNGNWRKLDAATTPSPALEVSYRFKLDTPQSFFQPYVMGQSNAAVKFSHDSIVMINKDNPQSSTTTQAANISVGAGLDDQWHTVKLHIHANSFQLYLDGKLIGATVLTDFTSGYGVTAGFTTSASPATVSLDDIDVKSNTEQP